MVIEVYTRDTVSGTCEFRVPITHDHPDNAVLELTNPNDGDGSLVITVTPDDGTAPYDITLPEPTVDTNDFSTLAGQTITFPNGVTIYVPVASTYDAATTMLTLDDGTTINLSSFDTDTFATLAGRVITMADGSMITVPDAATYDPLTTVLTLDDGTTINLSAIDTDTFATFNPATNIITFADGSTSDLDDIDTDRYIDPASWSVNSVTGVVSYDLVDKDGNVVGNGSIDLSSFVASPHPNITGSGDIVVTGDSTVGWNVSFNEAVYVAGANVTITGTGTALDPYVVSASAAPASDGVVTGLTIDGANVLTVTRSVGGPLTIDLSSLVDPTDGVVTSGTLDAGNQLILTRTIGGPITVDLSSLAGGANVADMITNIVLNGTTLEVTGQNGAFNGNIDLSSLAGGGGTADGVVTGTTFDPVTNLLTTTTSVGGPYTVDLTPLDGGTELIASTPANWTVGGTICAAHGLGAVPTSFHMQVVVTAAFGGYAVGDIIRMRQGSTRHKTWADGTMACWRNTFVSASFPYAIIPKTGTTAVYITPTNTQIQFVYGL